MEKDYDLTPSYFNNCEYFNKYLGKTSYYTSLQEALRTCITRTNPKMVLDLGCALGTTTFMLSEEFIYTEFHGLDMREDVISKTNRMQEQRDFAGLDNAAFVRADMTEFVKSDELRAYDFIYMLYSFHHIEDPNENKVRFLAHAYGNMKEGAYLWIGETFLPENGMSSQDLWAMRSEEGYASSFWNCLHDYPGIDLSRARELAGISLTEEANAGDHVVNRNEEYLVTRSWAIDESIKAGFTVVLNEPINAIGDGVILLKK